MIGSHRTKKYVVTEVTRVRKNAVRKRDGNIVGTVDEIKMGIGRMRRKNDDHRHVTKGNIGRTGEILNDATGKMRRKRTETGERSVTHCVVCSHTALLM